MSGYPHVCVDYFFALSMLLDASPLSGELVIGGLTYTHAHFTDRFP